MGIKKNASQAAEYCSHFSFLIYIKLFDLWDFSIQKPVFFLSFFLFNYFFFGLTSDFFVAKMAVWKLSARENKI